MEGRVIFKGKAKDGRDYVIRYPKEGDQSAMTDYINELSAEKTFVRFQGESISLEDEEKYLHNQLENIKKHKTVELFIECEGKIYGISAIDLKDKTESHEGVLGISVSRQFRGQGLGKQLMALIVEEAKHSLPELKIISLGVFGDNDLAYKMYQRFGFKEYGRLPEGSRHKNAYVDHVYMFLKISLN
ncbi:MAG: N-acetyltransferase family protein [Candidatus Levyibacteriota bacterium]